MIDVLTRTLGWYDPQMLGESARGWMLGLCQSLGDFWPGIRGGHVVYAGTGGSVDYDHPIGFVDASSATPNTIQTWPGVWLPNTTYTIGLRAISPGGVEDVNTTLVMTIATDGSGVPLPAVPNAPIGVVATPGAGGIITLTWDYDATNQQTGAASYNVYHNNGSGAVDYVTPIGNVTGKAYQTAAYAHATTVMFAVRSVASGGAEEGNTNTVTATADALGPNDIGAPTITAGWEQ